MNQSERNNTVKQLLSKSQFEVIPMEDFDSAISKLPNSTTIAIPTSSEFGIERTIDATLYAKQKDYNVVPHIAARYIEDENHLESILNRISKVGVTNIFVPAGDRNEPLGEYSSAVELLAKIDELGYSFEEIGITGYPDGHHFLDKGTLVRSMNQKLPYATYITTQLCFNPSAIVNWVRELRQRGISLPVEVGMPGVMNYFRLWRVSLKIGVSGSIEFIRKNIGFTRFIQEFVRERGKFTPDRLLNQVTAQLRNTENRVQGTHIYTFNQTQSTEAWRQDKI